jgi:uncharacterized protein (TIGR02444 family)
MVMSGSDTTANAKAHPGSPFWQFSLRLYRMPEVAPACIALQDDAGLDVNVLFFLLWNASLGKQLGEDDVLACDSHVAAWRSKAVVPLRAIRRALKETPGMLDATSTEAFRTRIKGAELEAERLQQEALYALAGPALGARADSVADAARANIEAYQTLFKRPFAPQAVETLLNAVSTLHNAPDKAAKA